AARASGRRAAAGGLPEQDLEDALNPTGYVRMSSTESGGITLSAGPFGLSASASETNTTTDVLDMNGDGVADALSGERVIPGRLTSGAALGASGHRMRDGRLRRRVGQVYGANVGISPVILWTSVTGRPLSAQTHMPSLGVGIGIGRTRTTDDLIDLNGDGLPDRLDRQPDGTVWVQLNLGDRFGEREPFGGSPFGRCEGGETTGCVDRFHEVIETSLGGEIGDPEVLHHDTTVTASASLGTGRSDYNVSAAFNTSTTRTTIDLADINGDGLPDLLFKKHGEPVRVQLNLGGTFGPPSSSARWQTPEDWGPGVLVGTIPGTAGSVVDQITPPDVLAGTGRFSLLGSNPSAEVGVYVTIPIPVWVICILINPGVSVGWQSDAWQMALMDIDGDGVADRVLRQSADAGVTPGLFVQRNEVTGRANLLSVVHRPLGGTIALDYDRTPNSVAMPQSRQVLTRVVEDDGVDVTGVPS
ncbi:MAG: toxin TcdB middle/N-terminal domain-containing protein, partial [Actinomycetota bacterium]